MKLTQISSLLLLFCSDEDDKLKIHIHCGGVFSNERNYVGGEIAPDMVVDPDLLTFSISKISAKVNEMWRNSGTDYPMKIFQKRD